MTHMLFIQWVSIVVTSCVIDSNYISSGTQVNIWGVIGHISVPVIDNGLVVPWIHINLILKLQPKDIKTE